MILENYDVITNAEKSRHSGNIFTENSNESYQAITALENTDNYDKKINGAITMGNFSLSDICFVDNEVLDSQHALILRCMAYVSEYILAEIKGQDLFELVDRLDAYCKLHFMDEEKLMEEMDFVGIEGHKAQHALFIRHLEYFMRRYEGLNCKKNIEEIDTLKEWYLEHIATFDMEYSERSFRLNEAATETCH